MEKTELFSIIERGEDSKHQFKKNITNSEALGAEMVAFSNSGGGTIFIGVSDDDSISGLSKGDIGRLNQLVSNSASQNVRPAINPITQNISTDKGFVLVANIPDGINKPYQDNAGVFWVKSGADKRRATSREEIQRMFQSSGLLYADESVSKCTIADVDLDYFRAFFERQNGETLEEQTIPLQKIIENMNLGADGQLNIAGALIFAKNPSPHLPMFIVKAGCFPGTDIATGKYIDSRDIGGKLEEIFRQTVSFILSNIRHVQGDKNINSLGDPEIPRISIEEVVANALVHRDYFVSAPIRVFVFDDRVEIISPGHLPNHLTIENIKSGNSIARNPVLASFANKILPYRGYGSGILRATRAYPKIEFVDDRHGNMFKVIFQRQESEQKQESRQESRQESKSLEARVLNLLSEGELSRSELAARLELKKISGALNKVIAALLAENKIERTIADKPNSRLQKYRLVG